MEELISNFVSQIVSNFNFGYMIGVNILTYLLIKALDWVNLDKPVLRWQKRFLLITSIITLSFLYLVIGFDDKITLLNSSILAPVFWSWILKPVCKRMGINYKKIDETLG